MSFRSNNYQQFSLSDQLYFLSDRKRRMLDRSWARIFSDQVFTSIDELIFAPLYSEHTNSRPNAPINVIVGALIIKELTGMTDDEVMESCEFDLRFQYALHTTSFENQPISDRTFSRFRSRCAAYELATGIDLIHECFNDLADKIRNFMKISPDMCRMDSMMVGSNIRKMGRLELLYTCLANLVKRIKEDGRQDLLEGLEHYAEANDANKVLYHDRSTPTEERLQTVIDDASALLPKCQDQYHDTVEYQLLERAVNEQTKDDDSNPGHKVPKTKDDGMTSDVLQNPSDPDATFRMKAKKQHRGYSANLTEAVDENGSVLVSYQYDVNTRSDSSFIQEAIMEDQLPEDTKTVIADGAYSGEDVRNTAAAKDITVKTTDLLGRKPNPILEEFKFSEDGTEVLECPEGHQPKTSRYDPKAGRIYVSFAIGCCKNCPRRESCPVKEKVRTTKMFINTKTIQHMKEQQELYESGEIGLIARIRNGIETVPSLIRNKFNVDRMPVRGKLRTKQFFGFKVMAVNCIKLIRSVRGLEKCRTLEPVNA